MRLMNFNEKRNFEIAAWKSGTLVLIKVVLFALVPKPSMTFCPTFRVGNLASGSKATLSTFVGFYGVPTIIHRCEIVSFRLIFNVEKLPYIL